MRRFVFQFEALLRYRRSRRQLVQLLLAQVRADEAALADQSAALDAAREALLDELRTLSAQGSVDVDRTAARRFHAARLSGERLALEQRRQVVAGQAKLCYEALAKADQEVRLLEKLEERQRAEFLREQERREARDREETWQAMRLAERAR